MKWCVDFPYAGGRIETNPSMSWPGALWSAAGPYFFTWK
jgi:hypothetical protein